MPPLLPTVVKPFMPKTSLCVILSGCAKNQTDALLEKMGGVTPQIAARLVELYNQAATSNNIQDEEDLAKNARVTVEL